jgi:hypothetical protein
MRLIAWALLWIVGALAVTRHFTYVLYGFFDPTIWQAEVRTAGSVFFMAALIIGGVLTTHSAFQSRKRFFYREDWSFICVLVTVGLFGISLLF